MSKAQAKLTDQIRLAIENCGESRYRISQETGIAQAVLSKFVNRKAGMTLESLNTLAAYLGLAIVVTKPKRTQKGE